MTPYIGVVGITIWCHNPENHKFNVLGLCILVGEAEFFMFWSVSSRNGTSAGCGWRLRLSDMEGNCKHIK